MLEVNQLTFKYASSNHDASKAGIDHVSFTAQCGKMTVILGPNGAGKTTLFRSILGALTAQSGCVRVQGKDLAGLSTRERARHLAYVPQEWQSPFRFTVLEAVVMGFSARLSLLATPGAREEREAMMRLESLGIAHLAQRGIDEISGGERQLALLARALLQKAPAILLDEPTSHLDLSNQMKVLGMLASSVRQDGLTAVVTIHDPNLAAQFADYVVMIKEGRIFAEGDMASIMRAEVLEALYQHPIEMTMLSGRPIMRGKQGLLQDTNKPIESNGAFLMSKSDLNSSF
ncbi:MAG: ABC transporter ATP-binding protein [Oxalobacter sp.]|nr:MAG: ABC transporter ATP-binding protein [Oxalobacter sp.]